MTNRENDSNDPLLEIKIETDDSAAPSEPATFAFDSSESLMEQESAPPLDADEPSVAQDPFTEIKEQISNLSQEFESKLKYDEHKNKIIDDLHQTLQEHRQGILQKYVQRIFTDVLKVVDDIRKCIAHYAENGLEPADTAQKLLKFLEATASDLEDLFAWEGIVPFICEGDRLDASRQRVVNKIQIEDPAKDKTIAARLRPGYELDGKVIRPEIVSIFVFQNNNAPEDEKSDAQTS